MWHKVLKRQPLYLPWYSMWNREHVQPQLVEVWKVLHTSAAKGLYLSIRWVIRMHNARIRQHKMTEVTCYRPHQCPRVNKAPEMDKLSMPWRVVVVSSLSWCVVDESSMSWRVVDESSLSSHVLVILWPCVNPKVKPVDLSCVRRQNRNCAREHKHGIIVFAYKNKKYRLPYPKIMTSRRMSLWSLIN